MIRIAVPSLVLLCASPAFAADLPNCVAFDEGGAVLASADASGAMDCSRKMQEAVKAAKCAGQGRFSYSIQAPKTNRRTPQAVYCKK